MSKKIDEIKALEPVKYENLDKSYKFKSKRCSASIDKAGLSRIIALIASVSDGTVLFSIIDYAITQSEFMGWVVTACVALTLNFIVLVIVKYLIETIYKTNRFAIIPLILLTTVFFALYGSTVYLRFAYADLNGGVKSAKQQLVNMSATGENIVEEEEKDETEELLIAADTGRKNLAITILLCLSPLCTSILVFGIEFGNNVIKKRIDFCETFDRKCNQAISDTEAALVAMNPDIARDIALDEEAARHCIEMIISIGNSLKAESRFFLSEYLADPSATSSLSADMICDPEETYLSGNNGEDSEAGSEFIRLAMADFNRAERSAI